MCQSCRSQKNKAVKFEFTRDNRFDTAKNGLPKDTYKVPAPSRQPWGTMTSCVPSMDMNQGFELT